MLFDAAGMQHGEPASSRPTQEKIGRGFGKNAGEWTGRVEISKEELLAVSVACMAIHRPTPGPKGRTFKLCVLTRWDFNVCVRSSTLRGKYSWKVHKGKNRHNSRIKGSGQARLVDRESEPAAGTSRLLWQTGICLNKNLLKNREETKKERRERKGKKKDKKKWYLYWPLLMPPPPPTPNLPTPSFPPIEQIFCTTHDQ